jgi:hypothetical protein
MFLDLTLGHPPVFRFVTGINTACIKQSESASADETGRNFDKATPASGMQPTSEY